ncbi:MAG: hypothetical protein R3F11_10065 [Verrucomicrobiales bacterium]
MRDLGKLSVPHLVSVFEGGDPEDYRLFESTITLLGDLGDGARSAAPHLLEIAEIPVLKSLAESGRSSPLGKSPRSMKRFSSASRVGNCQSRCLSGDVAYAIIISKTPAQQRQSQKWSMRESATS